MALMYLDMINRVQDEIQRTDLDQQIQLAIQQAVQYFQNDAFYLSDAFMAPVTLVAGTQSYNLPTDFAWDRDVYISQNGERTEMRKVSFEFLQAEDSEQTAPFTTGAPIDYALFNNTIYFFPRPDSSNNYKWYMSYVSQIPAPVSMTDSNFWTTTAEPVIRNWTKYLLYNEVMQQPDLGQQFQTRAMEEHLKLREVTAQRKWTGNITATKF